MNSGTDASASVGNARGSGLFNRSISLRRIRPEFADGCRQPLRIFSHTDSREECEAGPDDRAREVRVLDSQVQQRVEHSRTSESDGTKDNYTGDIFNE